MSGTDNSALSQVVITFPDLFEWIKILVPPFLAFFLGYWSSRSLERWRINRMRPVIEIQNNVVTRGIPFTNEHGTDVPFIANRIRVLNRGRTGAVRSTLSLRQMKLNGLDGCYPITQQRSPSF
jgi:hypothetical protein